MDHDRAALNVGHLKVWRDDCSGGVAADIDPQHRKVAFVAFTMRSEVLAGVVRVIMPARCQACRRLAVRSGTRPAIRIDVNMKAMIARRQISKLGHDYQALVRIGKTDSTNNFADAISVDRVQGNGLGVGYA